MAAEKQTLYNLRVFPTTNSPEYPSTNTGTKIKLKHHLTKLRSGPQAISD